MHGSTDFLVALRPGYAEALRSPWANEEDEVEEEDEDEDEEEEEEEEAMDEEDEEEGSQGAWGREPEAVFDHVVAPLKTMVGVVALLKTEKWSLPTKATKQKQVIPVAYTSHLPCARCSPL